MFDVICEFWILVHIQFNIQKRRKIELGPISFCVSLPEFLSTTLLEDLGKVSKTAKQIILKEILQTSLSKLNFHNAIESA